MNDISHTTLLASSAEQTLLREIPIGRVYVDPSRSFDASTVSDLEKSLTAVGQINPICVRPVEGDPAHDWVLIAGLNRLQACENAGLTTVLARVFELDDVQARLLQLDENLVRKNLSPAEKDAAIGERRALHDLTHDDRAKAAHIANQKMGREHDVNDTVSPAFSETLAARTGVSRRTIERSVNRASTIGTERLKQLAGTALDKPGELEALAKLAEPEREALIEQAVAGKKVSARRLVKKTKRDSTNLPETPLDRLQTAWEAATDDDRREFLDRNGLTRAS